MFRRIWPSSGFMPIKIPLYKLRELRYHNSRNLYSEILIDIKPDDGHIRSKHVIYLTLKNIHLFYII
jgi:hypothetical protein